MDNILLISEEALNRYFITLSQFGYKKYGDVNKLLVLLFIEEILSGEMSFFITEEDYRVIINSIYCLAGNNCLIDFPSFEDFSTLTQSGRKDLIVRITEDSMLRNTEDSNFRVEA